MQYSEEVMRVLSHELWFRQELKRQNKENKYHPYVETLEELLDEFNAFVQEDEVHIPRLMGEYHEAARECRKKYRRSLANKRHYLARVQAKRDEDV